MSLTNSDPIVVSVHGGVAEIVHNPHKIKVIIIDWDNIAEGSSHCPLCGKWVELKGDQIEFDVCPHCDFELDKYR